MSTYIISDEVRYMQLLHQLYTKIQQLGPTYDINPGHCISYTPDLIRRFCDDYEKKTNYANVSQVTNNLDLFQNRSLQCGPEFMPYFKVFYEFVNASQLGIFSYESKEDTEFKFSLLEFLVAAFNI